MRAELLLGRLGVAVAVFCATAVTATAVAIAMPSVRTTLGLAPQPPRPSYSPGEPIDLPTSVFGSSDHTLVVFFRSDCGVCERSKPLLARLTARDRPGSLRVVAVTGTQNPADADAFARQIGLDPSRLVRLDLAKLRLRIVPSIVVVDRSGTIQSALEGIPSPQAQDNLLRTITAFAQVH